MEAITSGTVRPTLRLYPVKTDPVKVLHLS